MKCKLATEEDLKALNRLFIESPKEIWGRVFWSVLHLRAKGNALSDSWLDAFEEAIPCPFCRAHFKSLREAIPIESASSQFVWSWFLHNIVNSKINRPVMSLREAMHIHSAG